MHDQPSYPCRKGDTHANRDWMLQRLVLDSLFGLHPVQVTLSELVREIADDLADFGTRDDIERAVRDLEGIGIVHRHEFLKRDDAIVIPTRSALHLHALMEDDWR